MGNSRRLKLCLSKKRPHQHGECEKIQQQYRLGSIKVHEHAPVLGTEMGNNLMN